MTRRPLAATKRHVRNAVLTQQSTIEYHRNALDCHVLLTLSFKLASTAKPRRIVRRWLWGVIMLTGAGNQAENGTLGGHVKSKYPGQVAAGKES